VDWNVNFVFIQHINSQREEKTLGLENPESHIEATLGLNQSLAGDWSGDASHKSEVSLPLGARLS
jgi:hypothetical protein